MPAPGAQSDTIGVWRSTFAAFCAVLVGIGLARFAYTPLIPALIDATWFSASGAAYLGAANLAGYLAGALLARPVAARWPVPVVLRWMMALATAAFFACAWPPPFLWFFVWRFAAGLAGGSLMVLAPSAVLAHVPPARRGFAGGVIFTGVGLGIAAAGTLVPLLLRSGLTAAWIGLGGLALALTALAWHGWPAATGNAAGAAPPAVGPRPRPGPVLAALFVAYGLNAVGLVPHMVFLVDFIARGLGQGIEVGARYWVLFGLGASAGPVLAGALADRIGFGRALPLAFAVQGAAILVLALADGVLALAASSLIVGAFVPGIVPVVLGRIHELIPPTDPVRRQAAWSVATTAFAVGQAVGAYGLAFIFAEAGGFRPLFALGAAALVAALLAERLAARAVRRAASSG